MIDSIRAVLVFLTAGIPVMLIGAPGIGKTAIIQLLVAHLRRTLMTLIAATRPPEDFGGFPVPDHERKCVVLYPLEWAIEAVRTRAIVFLDEITSASKATMDALLRVVNEGVIGLTKLEGVNFILAGNPVEMTAQGTEISGTLSNRIGQIPWSAHAETFVKGMLEGWDSTMPVFPPVPEKLWEYEPECRAAIAAYIQRQGHKLMQLPKDETGWSHAYATCRSWEYASKVWAVARAYGFSQEVQTMCITGLVGDAAGLEFLTWYRDQDLPAPEDLLANPASWKLPSRDDQVYTTLMAVQARIQVNNTPARWDAGWKLAATCAAGGKTDLAAPFVKFLSGSKIRPPKAVPPPEARPFIPLLKAAGLL